MRRRDFVIGSAVAGTSIAYEGCSSSSILTTPLNVGGYTLNVEYATYTLGGFPMKTRTYNGSTVGPTMEVHPGSTLSVTINNLLPKNPAVAVPTGKQTRVVPQYRNAYDLMRHHASATVAVTGTIDPMNNPHDFNTTNLHVHGIQTVPHLFEPVGTSDPNSMMIAVAPGSTYHYNLPVPADHPSGLFWYHPHHHGSTDVQVSGGMAGLIVVRGAIDQVPEIATMREIFIVVQTINVNLNATTNVYEYEPVAYSTGPNAYTGGTDFTMFTTNGHAIGWLNNNASVQAPTPLPVPQFQMQPGEIVRVRYLNGTNGFFLPLVLPGMTSYLIGWDGINFLAPLQTAMDYTGTVTPANMQSVNAVVTSPANRLEFLVQAPSTPGTYTLSSASQNDLSFQFSAMPIAQFVVSGSPVSMTIPAALPQPSREYPLIADSEIVNHRTLTLNQNGTQPAGFEMVLTGFYVWIDNALYDEMHINQTVTAGTAEEWTILNPTMCAHPFHIHVNSFQLTKVNGVAVTPQFYDTFVVPPGAPGAPGSITFRTRFKEFRGKSVYHCHILQHEDTGMMNNIQIN
jgi:FtsP/CotA-like multicopper oxidase with cupredoxin domain